MSTQGSSALADCRHITVSGERITVALVGRTGFIAARHALPALIGSAAVVAAVTISSTEMVAAFVLGGTGLASAVVAARLLAQQPTAWTLDVTGARSHGSRGRPTAVSWDAVARLDVVDEVREKVRQNHRVRGLRLVDADGVSLLVVGHTTTDAGRDLVVLAELRSLILARRWL